MKFVIQRVTEANVTVNGLVTGKINKGYLVLIGIGPDDTKETADRMLKKLIQLRIFEDEQGKTNLSIKDVNGSLLLVSQFTLYADCKKGNRPSFIKAAGPNIAEPLYNYIISQSKTFIDDVQQGVFGADMKIQLTNDGPFTVILDSADIL